MIDPYSYMISEAVMRLFRDNGIVDPSINEIACEAFNKPMPDDPLVQPNTLGGEIFAGVAERIPKIRKALEANHNVLSTPINARYYSMGLRERQPRDSEVPVVLPGPGVSGLFDSKGRAILGADGHQLRGSSRTAGIRMVKENEEDPFFRVFTRKKGAVAIGTMVNLGRQAKQAAKIGALPAAKGKQLFTEMGNRLGSAAPAALIESLADGGK